MELLKRATKREEEAQDKLLHYRSHFPDEVGMITAMKSEIDELNSEKQEYRLLLKYFSDKQTIEPSVPEAEGCVVVRTSDQKMFSISRAAAEEHSGYFRALFETDCKEVVSGVVDLQIMSSDFQHLFDMFTYPPSAIGGLVGKNLSSYEFAKLLYNAKYFQMTSWIIHLLRNVNECCSSSYEESIRVCEVCSGHHICTIPCPSCSKPVCVGCREVCILCRLSHCINCSDCKGWCWGTVSKEPALCLVSDSKCFFSAVSFSLDSKYIATANYDNTANVWSVETGQLVKRFRGHDDYVISCSFSNDGKYIVTASYDKSARIWSIEQSDVVVLEGHTAYVYCARFSADDQSVATSSCDKTIKVWNPATGDLLKTIDSNGSGIRSICYSRDGKYLVSGSVDFSVKVWDAKTYEQISVFKDHLNSVTGVAFSNDSKLLASCSSDKSIRIYDLGGEVAVKILTGHADGVNNISFSPDGRFLASGGNDNIRIWDLDTGSDDLVINIHTNRVKDVCFSSDGRYLASASYDSTVRVWGGGDNVLAKTDS